jgi:hypothetical protein
MVRCVPTFNVAIAASFIVLLVGPGCALQGSPIGNNNVLEYHELDDPEAVCIAGHQAGVYA